MDDDMLSGAAMGAAFVLAAVVVLVLVANDAGRDACVGATGADNCEQKWVPVDDK